MNINKNETIWMERYRPVDTNDLVLPESIKQKFNQYAKNEDMLQDCTSLSADELQKLSVDAFNLIYNEFLELNKEHFSNSEDNSGETLDKKKS